MQMLESPHLRLIYASLDFESRNCFMGKLECPFKTPFHANVLVKSPPFRMTYAGPDFESRDCFMGKLERPFKPNFTQMC